MMTNDNSSNINDEFLYYKYMVGLDIGQVRDSSALVVVKRSWMFDEWKKLQYHFHCGFLKRWPLGTKYAKIIEETREICHDQAFIGQARSNGRWIRFGPILAVDATAVGGPIIEELLKPGSRLNGYGIIITGGTTHARTPGRKGYTVPKQDLVGAITRELQSGKLTISKSLPEANVLLKELRDFRAFTSASGHTVLAHRSGRHDDMVLALAMATWISTRARTPAMNPGGFWK